MNFIKKLSLITALVAVMLAFNACEEDTVAPVADVPTAPIGLEATSVNGTTVHIRWQDANTIDKTMLDGYTVTYYPSSDATKSMEVSAAASNVAFPITDLDSALEYTFEVVTNYDNGESSTKTTIEWAPALRFEKVSAQTIKLYTSDVLTGGSGIKLEAFDDVVDFIYYPEVLTTANMSDWNLGLYTSKGMDTIIFGSASQLNYKNASLATSSAMVGPARTATSLNDVFDSQGLDSKNYSQGIHNIASSKSSIVVYVKNTKANGDVHYAKVLLKYVNNSFIQGEDGETYVEAEISYQVNAGFPYAKK